jgi:hypothetical protein
MRSRNVKPSLFKNEILGVEDPLLTVVFIGLWCAADRAGRVEDRPLRLKAEILPYRENIDFNGYLTVLSRLEFIRRYEVDGIKVIEVINFLKHQNPHKTERDTELPEYKENTDSCCLTVKEPLTDDGLTDAARLIPDSLLLIPDSLLLIPDSKNKRRIPVFDPKKLQPSFFEKKDWLDLISHRRKKRTSETERAYESLILEFGKAVSDGFTAKQCIDKMTNRGWAGFEAQWMRNEKQKGNQQPNHHEEYAKEILADALAKENGMAGGKKLGSDLSIGTETHTS